MSSSYVVIEFSDNGGLAVVDSAWLTPRKSEVFWPPYKDRATFLKALKKHEECEESWKIYPVARVFFETDDLDRALKKQKTAEVTSNLETEEEEEEDQFDKRKRIITKRLYSTDDEETDDGHINKKLAIKRPPPIKSINFKKKANLEDVPLLCLKSVETANLKEPSVFQPSNKFSLYPSEHTGGPSNCSTTKVSIVDNLPKKIQTPLNESIGGPYNCSTTKVSIVDNVPKKIQTPLNESIGTELLLQHIISIKEQNKQILALLQSRPAEPLNARISKGFPIDNLENLLKHEHEQLEQEAGVRDLIDFCSMLGGDGISGRTYRILKELVTDKLASQFSFYGKRANKKIFADLKIKRVIVEAVKKKCNNATDREVEDAIKTWLKHAPQRVRTAEAKEIKPIEDINN